MTMPVISAYDFANFAEETFADDSPLKTFCRNKVVLLTGGLGDLGQVYVEKLLRCQVKRLYLLVGPGDADPFEGMLTSALFSKLTKLNSRFAQLIHTISGDLSAPGLALSAADRATLASSVQLIIHAGADTRFDAPLRDATLVNVRGTRELLRLAADTPSLLGFAHVSTVLAQCVQPTVDERFYAAPMVPQQLLDYVEAAEVGTGWTPAHLELLTAQMIQPYPNTYTFTMAVAERLVQDAAAKLPAIVVRPSIVLSTLDDPTPGFTNGEAHAVNELLIAVTTGSMRVIAAHPDRQAPVCFSDYVVNVTLAAMQARHAKGSAGGAAKKVKVDGEPNVVFNASVNHADLRWGSLFGGMVKNAHDSPTLRSVWTPRVHLMKCAVQVWLFVMLYEVLPGLMADAFLRLVGCPARVMPRVRRNAAARQEYAFFLRGSDDREIICDRVAELNQGLDKSDRAFFGLDLGTASFDWTDYSYKHGLGLKRYILGENLNNLEEAQRRQRKYRLAHGGVLVAYYATLVALVGVVFRCCGMCGAMRRLWEA